jgi:hypothetical protein
MPQRGGLFICILILIFFLFLGEGVLKTKEEELIVGSSKGGVRKQ